MKKYLLCLIILSISLVSLLGCSQQDIQVIEPVEEIKKCPATCDDDNGLTEDTCSAATGFECANIELDEESILDMLKSDINDALEVEYKYTTGKTQDSKMVTHHTSDGDPTENAWILIDVLDYDVDDETWTQYLSSQRRNLFMQRIENQRNGFAEYLEEKDYYFEESPHRLYVNHSLDEHMILDNDTVLEGFDESVFGSVDIYTIDVGRSQKSDRTTKAKFYHTISMAHRVSVRCTQNIAVHIYAEEPEYIQVDMSSTLMRATESSWVLRTADENRDILLDMAETVTTICAAY